jgi:hypothetical protein
MADQNLASPSDDGTCFVCGRRLEDHTRRQRRYCETQPLPITWPKARVPRWWRWWQ